ncbi:MAG: hypothetical protein OWT27_10895 [Firmicutes bacterium]|jgi:hypothetical protein|nr:hypothetical protein [Bacillota bacterium]
MPLLDYVQLTLMVIVLLFAAKMIMGWVAAHWNNTLVQASNAIVQAA